MVASLSIAWQVTRAVRVLQGGCKTKKVVADLNRLPKRKQKLAFQCFKKAFKREFKFANCPKLSNLRTNIVKHLKRTATKQFRLVYSMYQAVWFTLIETVVVFKLDALLSILIP